MDNPWKATLAGILDIVAGGSGLIGGLVLIILAAVGGSVGWFLQDEAPIWPFAAGTAFFVVLALITIGVGVVAVIGGVHALNRRRWGWAIIGSVAATLALFPVGVAAVVFTVLAEQEFAPPYPAPGYR